MLDRDVLDISNAGIRCHVTLYSVLHSVLLTWAHPLNRLLGLGGCGFITRAPFKKTTNTTCLVTGFCSSCNLL